MRDAVIQNDPNAERIAPDADTTRGFSGTVCPRGTAQTAQLRTARVHLREGRVSEAWNILSALRDGHAKHGAQVGAEAAELSLVCAKKFAAQAKKKKASDQAVRWYRIASELAPDVLENRLLWAQELMLAGQLNEAWAALLILQSELDISRDLSIAGSGASHPVASLQLGGGGRGEFGGAKIDTPADPKHQVAQLSAECAGRLGNQANVRGAVAAAASWFRIAVGLAPGALQLRLGFAGSLIRAGELDEARSILSALEDDAADSATAQQQVGTLRGKHARRCAYDAERPGGFYSIEGVDWSQVIEWRREATRLLPNLRSNWVRYAYALIYAGQFGAATFVVDNAPSPGMRAHLADYVGRAPEILEQQCKDKPFIYGREAYRYLSRGLPAVPTFGKCVIPRGWGQWSDRPIREAEYREWLSIPWANIGLVVGRQSGISVIDIDVTDREVIRAICDALPYSPWQRVGRRGMALAYRWTGLNNFQCVDHNDNPIVEHLSRHAQVMLPPSIHPQTNQPYRASRDLLDALPELPPLPHDIEQRLAFALEVAGCKICIRRT